MDRQLCMLMRKTFGPSSERDRRRKKNTYVAEWSDEFRNIIWKKIWKKEKREKRSRKSIFKITSKFTKGKESLEKSRISTQHSTLLFTLI